MSVQDVRNAAIAAERATRALAGLVIAAAAARPDDALAKIRAETVVIIVQLAEKRAKLIRREAAEAVVEELRGMLEELLQQAAEGLISREAGLEKLNRLEAMQPLWTARHARDAWETAFEECRQLAGEVAAEAQ